MVNVHSYCDVEILDRMVKVGNYRPERPSAAAERAHSVVYGRRAVEADLSMLYAPVLELSAGLLVQEIPVRGDPRAVPHVRVVTSLNERVGKRKQRSLADQWFPAEPPDGERGNGGELVVEQLKDGLFDLRTEDRRVLSLEAVRAVEVASQTGDDG